MGITFTKSQNPKRTDTWIKVITIKKGRRNENPEGKMGKKEEDDEWTRNQI